MIKNKTKENNFNMKKQKTDLQIKKDEIRKQILEKRSNLSLEEVDKKSEF